MAGRRPPSRGATWLEAVLAAALLGAFALVLATVFRTVGRAVTGSRTRTIAMGLAQQEMDALKHISYPQLLVTTAPATSAGFSPDFVYDSAAYPPQTFAQWAIPSLTRYVEVDYASLTGTVVSTVAWTAADPGMKKITVFISWIDAQGAYRKVQLDNLYANPGGQAAGAAMGTISGQVTNDNQVITTGVLIVASTAAISETPIAVVASSAATQAVLYSISSDAKGNYSLNVPGGAAVYNVRGFFPVLDPGTGTTAFTSKTLSGLSVAAGQTLQHQDLAWP